MDKPQANLADPGGAESGASGSKPRERSASDATASGLVPAGGEAKEDEGLLVKADQPLSDVKAEHKSSTSVDHEKRADLEDNPKGGASEKPPVGLLNPLKIAIDPRSNFSTPLGSPVTPDSAGHGVLDFERSGTPDAEGRPGRPRTGSKTDRSKRRSLEYPGSPQTVVSERQQLALLKQQARTDKQQSPDPSSSRDRPSTPSGSSTSSSKEGREARSVNRRDGKGETPLHVACRKGDMPSIRKLLDDGADVNAVDYAGWTPLHEAANHGREDVTKVLVKNKADIHAKGGSKSITPLMDAVVNGYTNIVKFLLRVGADPKAEDGDGQNCFALADKDEEMKATLKAHAESGDKHSTSFTGTAYSKKREDDPKFHTDAPRSSSLSQTKPDPKAPVHTPKVEPLSVSTHTHLKDSSSAQGNVKGSSSAPGERSGKPHEALEAATGTHQTGAVTPVSRHSPVNVPVESIAKSSAAPVRESQYEDISDDDEPKTPAPRTAPPVAPAPPSPLVNIPPPSAVPYMPGPPPTVLPQPLWSSPLPSFTQHPPPALASVTTIPPVRTESVVTSSAPRPQLATTPPSTSSISSASSNTSPMRALSPVKSDPTPPRTVSGSAPVATAHAVTSIPSVPAVSAVHSPAVSAPGAVVSGPVPAVPVVPSPVIPVSAVATSVPLIPLSVSVTGPSVSDTSVSLAFSSSAVRQPDKLMGTMTAGQLVKGAVLSEMQNAKTTEMPPTHAPSVVPPSEVINVRQFPMMRGPLGVWRERPPLHTSTTSTTAQVAAASARAPGDFPSLRSSIDIPPAQNKPIELAVAPAPPTPTSKAPEPSVTVLPGTVAVSVVAASVPFPLKSATPAVPTVTPEKAPQTSAAVLPIVTPAERPLGVGGHTALPAKMPPAIVPHAVHEKTPGVPAVLVEKQAVSQTPLEKPALLPSPVEKPPAVAAVPVEKPVIPVPSTLLPAPLPVTPAALMPPLHIASAVHPTETPTIASPHPALTVPPPTHTSPTPRPVLTPKPMPSTPRVPPLNLIMPPALPIPPISLAVPPGGTPLSPSSRAESGKSPEKKGTGEKKEKGKEVKSPGSAGVLPPERLLLSIKKQIKKEGAGEREGDPGGPSGGEGEGAKDRAAEGEPSGSSRKKDESTRKPMTRQRAQAQVAATTSTGAGRRRGAKDDKPARPRGAKRAAMMSLEAASKEGQPASEEPKQKRARSAAKKLKIARDEAAAVLPPKLVVEPPPPEPRNESPARLPFKKRITIRNEIEEFVNQRRQVEENWRNYTNNFPMKVFPKNFNDYLIMRKGYSAETELPKKLDPPSGLQAELKTFFAEQEEERRRTVRQHIMERDGLIMSAEQEMMRLHQRFCRITAGISVPYSACMIISEQESNRSFQSQEQDDRSRNATRNRITMRDLIKWLEESDDNFDYAKKELLTRHRLEARMIRSKQRLDWAWKMDDLNMSDPGNKRNEESDNLYVPEIVVEDFVMLPDQ